MIDIVFNCLPPFRIDMPSAPLSVLKGFLLEKKINSYIKYWNISYLILLQKYFDVSKLKEEQLISSFLLNEFTESKASTLVNSKLYEFRKNKHTSPLEFGKSIKDLKIDLKRFIKIELEDDIFKSSKLFCFSSKYIQWIPGVLLAEELKKRYPKIKVVIGGLDTKKEAYELINTWTCFDFAIYGEGENPLLDLYLNLNNTAKYSKIPQLVYRIKDETYINTTKSQSNFCNDLYPNYEDYFNQIKGYNQSSDFKVRLPINAVRGCNWNKCKFCSSKNGYTYKERTPQSIVNEIEFMMNKYNKFDFVFVDNSSFRDIKVFELMTENLINLMNNSEKTFTLGLTLNHSRFEKHLINKMYVSGIRRIQIGFESFSDNLLKLMNKENSLADNLLFLKFALQYDILFPLIVIRNIPGETRFDVIESINNLHYFRFYLCKKNFDLQYSDLSVSIDSIYSKQLTQKDLKKYSFYQIEDYLPEKFLKVVDKSNLLFFSFSKQNIDNKAEWFLFNKELHHYKDDTYSYKTVTCNDSLYYYEFFNGQLITTLIFDEVEYLDVLKMTENKKCSIDYLYNEITGRNNKLTKKKLTEIIDNLKNKHLVYVNNSYTEIVSTIILG